MMVVLLAALLAVVPDPCPGGTVVTRADLEAAGATTIHDALRLAGVPGVSAHGFDTVPTSTLGVPFASSVRVLLDGAPVTRGGGIEPLGIEALPVAVGEVARVVVCPGDGVAGGAFGGPWVDVQTEAPPGRAYAAATYGNEAGDPGPLRYLDPSLPNVDRWGPDYEAAVVARTPTTTGWLSIRDRDFLPTDPAVLDRTRPATTRYPKRYGTVVALGARHRGLRVRAGVRRFDDMPFVPGLATEVPLDHVSAQATVSGARQRGAARVWGHAHLGHVRLDRPAWSAVDLDPSWRDIRGDAALAASLASGGAVVSGGVRSTVVAAEAPAFSDRVALGRGWAQARSQAEAAGVGLTLAGATSGGAVGASGQAEAWWRAGPALGLHLAATARRTLPEETLDADAWVGRGYDALSGARPERPEEVAHVRASAAGRHGALDWRLGLDAQRGRQVVVSRTGTFVEARGRVVGGTARLGWRGDHAEVSAEAAGRCVSPASPAYGAAWARLPRATAAVQATLRPDARLALWARLGVASGTRWRGVSASGLPPQTLLDLGLSKRAWGDRLRLSLAGRNVLGVEEQTHPLGAPLAPRLFVRAEARL